MTSIAYPDVARRLWIARVAARCALAAVWIHEGLVPKILAQRASEISLVQDSALYVGTPSGTLAAVGVAEIAFGFWLLSGRAEKLAAALSTIGICALVTVVVWVRPSSLIDPLGGISKNLGLLACGIVIWVLSEHSQASGPGPARARIDRADPDEAEPHAMTPPLSRGARMALIVLALTGTVAHAASLAVEPPYRMSPWFSVRIAVAAALSWPILGLALLAADRRHSVWTWIDLCLKTMVTGIAFLVTAAAFNVLHTLEWIRVPILSFFLANVVLLLLSNLAMGARFVSDAHRIGMPVVVALALWVFVLNGMFLSLVML